MRRSTVAKGVLWVLAVLPGVMLWFHGRMWGRPTDWEAAGYILTAYPWATFLGTIIGRITVEEQRRARAIRQATSIEEWRAANGRPMPLPQDHDEDDGPYAA